MNLHEPDGYEFSRTGTRALAAPGAAAFKPASASFPMPGNAGYMFVDIFNRICPGKPRTRQQITEITTAIHACHPPLRQAASSL